MNGNGALTAYERTPNVFGCWWNCICTCGVTESGAHAISNMALDNYLRWGCVFCEAGLLNIAPIPIEDWDGMIHYVDAWGGNRTVNQPMAHCWAALKRKFGITPSRAISCYPKVIDRVVNLEPDTNLDAAIKGELARMRKKHPNILLDRNNAIRSLIYKGASK